MVLYRKYRPQTLDDLVGQVSVKETLKSAFASQKLAHAYLLCGPRGTGKTSTARILAKIVNCQEKESPCNKCPSCLSITDGSSLDVVEMDAASNRGIEDIRSLRENIKLAPTSSKKKVYIIDEVHMLSTDAFNALLKTLEEPPAHVLFILATTELQKIPATILSRVQKLNFESAKVDEIKEAISRVAKEEKIALSDDVLTLIAQKAQGSFRDGIKFLDMLSSFDKIDSLVVEKVLGSSDFDGTVLILEDIADGNSTEALKALTGQLSTGVSIKEFNLTVLEILRQLIFFKNNLGEHLVKPNTTSQKYEVLSSLVEKFSLERLMKTTTSFQTSLEQSRYVSIPSLPLELAVVESCIESGQVCVDSEEKEKERKENKQSLRSDDLKQSLVSGSKTENPKSEKTGEHIGLPLQDSGPDIAKLMEKWSYVLETIKQYNYSLEALLRSSKILSCSGPGVVIEVPYSFHQRILEAPKARDLIESIFSDILSRSIKISTVLGQKPVMREELANVEVAADDEIVRLAAEIFNSEPN